LSLAAVALRRTVLGHRLRLGRTIIYAAQQYGLDATGITLSERQAELARERIRKIGLTDRCRVLVCDIGELDGDTKFEKIASIGMVEHVGARNLRGYFASINRLLASGGALLNSGIARTSSEPAHRNGSFTEAYVFPDGELETFSETLQAAEDAGLELQTAQNCRRDCALTLRHWVRRLQEHAHEARRATDDVTYRIWRLYMTGSAVRFMAGELYLLSASFRKPVLRSHDPWRCWRQDQH
jgi:cyclopropane-fatty-acyl-phospholipid synthase